MNDTLGHGTDEMVALSSLKKLPYTSPNLRVFGSVASLTLGSGGTSIDGDLSRTQKGKGNDGN